MTTCDHHLEPLYNAVTQHQRIDVLLKGLGRYLRCTECGRIGYLSPTGWCRWLSPEIALQRQKKADEWHRYFEERPELA
jgi:hypothetical protein